MRFKIIILYFLILSSSIFGQKSRVGETPKFSSKINLVSFNNSSTDALTAERLMEYKKPIAIFFWASTCPPCIKELNAVKKMDILNKIKGKAKIIVVSTDNPKNYGAAKSIAKKNSWKFDMYFDKGYALRNNLLNKWFGIPQVIVFDKDKKIALHKFGYYKGNEEKIVNKIKELME